eukprot:TRINITY_DN4890_c0_g1_i6.p1 TRINITY_DN4890_c0_g1~~TRINITY_DN4890_c0_g1_i6.p1  ORF type:complete len:273 (+),score=23.08 TRINITY_DN4890_c0_g1_i6:85-903(+)
MQLRLSSMLAGKICLGALVQHTHSATINYAVHSGDQTCTTAQPKGVALSPSQDANQCNGGWTPPTGNDNSYRIHSCSSKCICFTQFTGGPGFGYSCASSGAGYIGSNVKESCSDRCSGDCDGPNCQFTAPHGIYNRTWIKLAEPPSCDNQVPDAEYKCDTTGMSPYDSYYSSQAAQSTTTTPANPGSAAQATDTTSANPGSAADPTTTSTLTTPANPGSTAQATTTTSANPGSAADPTTTSSLSTSGSTDATCSAHIVYVAIIFCVAALFAL